SFVDCDCIIGAGVFDNTLMRLYLLFFFGFGGDGCTISFLITIFIPFDGVIFISLFFAIIII
ncbi:MAG: hypothetical protein ACK53Y_23710, partial [bacterium]